MKKVAAIILVCLTMCTLVCCGSNEYVGEYSKSSSSATFTVTLSANGDFKYERKFKSSYSPFDEDSNVRKGTYTVDGDEIKIKYSYYEVAEKKTLNKTATATVKDGKLVISDGELAGTYAKK